MKLVRFLPFLLLVDNFAVLRRLVEHEIRKRLIHRIMSKIHLIPKFTVLVLTVRLNLDVILKFW